jgi:hypothetical protein
MSDVALCATIVICCVRAAVCWARCEGNGRGSSGGVSARERHLPSVSRQRFQFDSPSDLIPNFLIRATLFHKSIGFWDFSFRFGGSVLFGVLIGSGRKAELGSNANRGISERIGGEEDTVGRSCCRYVARAAAAAAARRR